MRRTIHKHQILSLLTVLMLLLVRIDATPEKPAAVAAPAATTASYIVQASSSAAAGNLVAGVGGRVTATLSIIDAVGAELSDEQVQRLRAAPGRIRVFKDGTLRVSGSSAIDTYYPAQVGADKLHRQGITGKGVTVAILDTGLWRTRATRYGANGKKRILAEYDATLDHGHDDDDDNLDDWNGHGTHITSIVMSSGRGKAGHYQGIAPNASVVAVRAFEPDGAGSYLNVIKALDWIVKHRKDYDIRILNLSFGAPPASQYWDDPVNQAVMAAWKKGIIVVAAAGNGGPGPMTVGVPGNVPYVITVGAMTDNFTPQDTSDDRLASFSAAGPTFEGFVKPELLAPGGHILGQMPPYAWLPLKYPEYVQRVGHYFTMSGTSQAAAVVSGVLALMLEADPELRPDEAKCRVMASARMALKDDGTPAYSVFQQGAGLIDAVAAVSASADKCANRGMNIKDDLKDKEHYVGLAGVDANGTYYLVDDRGDRLSGSGFEWSQGTLWRGGASWQQGAAWNQGMQWTQGVAWDAHSLPNSDALMVQGALWPEGSLWPEGLTQPVSTNTWVDAE